MRVERKVTNREFKEFTALRLNGADLSDLVDDYGQSRAMCMESLYQKFMKGGMV